MTIELVNDHQPRAKGIPRHREPAGHSSSEISSHRSLEAEFTPPVPDDAGGRYRRSSDEHVNEQHRCGPDETTAGPEPAGSVTNAEKDKDKDKDNDKDKDKGREQEEQRGNEVEEEEEDEEEEEVE